MPTGVENEKLESKTRYSIGDREISRQDALGAVGNKIPNDAQLPWVTVVSADKSLRESTEAALQSAGILSAARFQSYSPDDWAVRDAGFVVPGNMSIYVQKHDGTVLLRLDNGLDVEAVEEALRRADPKYDPKLDPNKNSTPFKLPELPPWGWAAIGAVAVWLLLRKDK